MESHTLILATKPTHAINLCRKHLQKSPPKFVYAEKRMYLNVRLRGEIDRLKERLDNKARLMIFQEGYIDKQSQAIKTLKSDKYQKPKYQEKLKEVDDRYKSRIKSLEASYLYKEETLRYYIDNFRKEKIEASV